MSKRFIDLDDFETNACYSETTVDIIEYTATHGYADVVEVVRCVDCKWCRKENWGEHILYGCDYFPALHIVTPDSFCSYGERKTEKCENDCVIPTFLKE